MTESETITTVMRALADPTRRAVFERIVNSDEITVVELTKRMTILAVELRDWITPGLLCAALYFVMSFPLARLARRIERRLEPVGSAVVAPGAHA